MEMMRAIIQRQSHPLVTPGGLILPWVSNQSALFTLEPPWKDNQHDISCIPAGVYTCVPYSSPKHPDTWEVTNVPNRTAIHFDVANYANDIYQGDELVHKCELLGCIALGFGLVLGTPMLIRSREALDYTRHLIGIKTTWELEIREA